MCESKSGPGETTPRQSAGLLRRAAGHEPGLELMGGNP